MSFNNLTRESPINFKADVQAGGQRRSLEKLVCSTRLCPFLEAKPTRKDSERLAAIAHKILFHIFSINVTFMDMLTVCFVSRLVSSRLEFAV